MPSPSLTYTLTNGTTADATQVMTNFTDLLNGVTDGTKDLSISALTCAGTATLNGHVNLGNSSADDLTITASLASTVPVKTTNSYNIGDSTHGLAGVYFGTADTDTARIVSAALSASRTYTLPDAGAAADFVMTAGSQTIGGVKTFSTASNDVTPALISKTDSTTMTSAYTALLDLVSATATTDAVLAKFRGSGTHAAVGLEKSTNNFIIYQNTSGTPAVALRASTAGVLSFPNGVAGATDGSDAAAGIVGEYLSASLARASASALTTATALNVTSLSLTAGDWDVQGAIGFIVDAGVTTITVLQGAINTTSATYPGSGSRAIPTATTGVYNWQQALPTGTTINNDTVIQSPSVRVSLSSTTTYYLIAQASFGASTLSAFGALWARRVR